MRSRLGIIALSALLFPAVGWADVRVSYNVDGKAIKGAISGTSLSFALFQDAACTVAAAMPINVNVENVSIITALKRVTPKGATKGPATDTLSTVLAASPSAATLYLKVTGTGVTAVGGDCQLQFSTGVARTQKLVIPASAFQSDGGGDDANFFYAFSFGLLPAGSGACMQAAVSPLPAGATITSFEAHILDNDAGADLTINLDRIDNTNAAFDSMASVSSTGASGSVQNLSTSSIAGGTEIVDTDHSYDATFCWPGTPNIALIAVGVSYTLP